MKLQLDRRKFQVRFNVGLGKMRKLQFDPGPWRRVVRLVCIAFALIISSVVAARVTGLGGLLAGLWVLLTSATSDGQSAVSKTDRR